MMNWKLMRFWKVNFFDWLWFVFILKGDEFSHKLNINAMQTRGKNFDFIKVIKLREKAHKIDIILNDV